MKVRRSLLPLVVTMVLTLLAACGAGQTATQPAAPAATTASDDGAATNGAAETAAAAPDGAVPTSVPTPTPGLSTVGTGATKIVWWHISTQDNQRENWQNLANAFVKDHPDVSIEITVLENEAFKSKLATAMQSGSPPDLFQSWGGGVLKQYADAGLVQDLTPALGQNGWGESFQP